VSYSILLPIPVNKERVVNYFGIIYYNKYS
jgi:hypothetical protein